MMKHVLAALLALSPLAATVQSRPFTPQDLVMLDRIGEPAVSADGKTLIWSQRETDLAANRGRYDLFRLDLATPGAQPVRFQPGPASNETSPAITPDGQSVYYLSTLTGTAQLWVAPLAGGPARQVTDFPLGIAGFSLSPRGDRAAVWLDAAADCATLACAADKAKTAKGARVYDRLFVRHWDNWADGTQSRLYSVGLPVTGLVREARLLSVGLDGDVPSKPHGDGSEVSWSPDGTTLYFALREAGRSEAWSTNLDIFAVPADGSARPVNLTSANPATDTSPTVSPDGRTLAWLAMARPGYEADRLVIWLRDIATGKTRALTQGWDRSVDSLAWSPDSRALLVTAHDTGRKPAFRIDARSGRVTKLTESGSVSALLPLAKGAIAVIDSLTSPADLWRIDKPGHLTRLTSVNAARLAGIDLGTTEQMRFAGSGGDPVYAWVVKPAGLKPGAKVPLAYLVHGGPQSSFGDSWSYRWNPQAWAGAGYAAVMVDFHGSTGYGQTFTDSIGNDWGGAPLEDLKRGLAATAARYDWIDTGNACAAGGSYGGFMMAWIAGHWPDGFKCLVNHAGIFDQRSMYYGTEELWFPEREFGGPYHSAAANYERWNPANAVTSWRTPMLVIHGQLDFRVPYLQGIQAFTALQRQGIESRLVMFPDENHWILKPANSLKWHEEVFGWVDRHLRR